MENENIPRDNEIIIGYREQERYLHPSLHTNTNNSCARIH